MLFMFDNTFTQGNNNLFLMLFHSPNWPRILYQTGCRQETDGMLKGVIEENLITGLFMKVRQSSPKKSGEPFPARVWEGREGRILASRRGLQMWEGWPQRIGTCDLRWFRAATFKGGAGIEGAQWGISPNIHLFLSPHLLLVFPNDQLQQVTGLCDALSLSGSQLPGSPNRA